MIRFEVSKMTCGHCAKAVTEAVKSVDPAAWVHVDLGTKTVAVESAAATAALSSAIHHAGYEVRTIG